MKLMDWIIQLIILTHLSIVGLFSPAVAQRAKRMLFLTSLATTLAKEGIVRKTVLDTLNNDLHLARNSRCLLLGEEVSRYMWKHDSLGGESLGEGIGLARYLDFKSEDWNNERDIKDNPTGFLSLNEISILSDKVINAAPKWVKYDNSKMQEDMTDFFITNPVIKQVAHQ